MCLVSLGLVDPNKFWPFTFTRPGFSKTCWVRFPQARVTNISIGLVSLGLENLQKYAPRFPRPSGHKQTLTCVYFSSAWFLKIYWRSFRSASRRQHSLGQRNMYLVSLGLLDTNKIWPGFTFPQPGFSKNCRGSFPSASYGTNIHIGVVSLGL